METDVQIEIYTVGRLSNLLSSKEFWFQNVAPITKHRAQFIINSPRSKKDDPVLFVAKVAGKIAGYRLIFPDRIFVDSEDFRLGWGSCYWVDKAYRGKGIGKVLFQKSLGLWDGNIGSLIQSKDAARVYEGNSDFYCVRESTGYQFVLKINVGYWLEKKLKFVRKLRLLTRAMDLPVNLMMTFRQFLWMQKAKPLLNKSLEYYQEIEDEETTHFVNKRNRDTLLRRGIQEINAIVKYPTSLATPLVDVVKSRYYFATNADRFDYYYFKIYDDRNDLIGLALINVEGKELRLLYYFSKESSNHSIVYNIVLAHARSLKIEIISSYDDKLNQFILSSGFPTLFNRRQNRKSFLPVRYKTIIPKDFLIFDGDGA